MMSRYTEQLQDDADAIEEVGSAATLIVVASPVYGTDAAVSGTPAEYEVTVEGPQDESKRWGATQGLEGVTATFYVAAKGLAVTPKIGDDLVHGDRRWRVIACAPTNMNGAPTCFRLDCGEVASDG